VQNVQQPRDLVQIQRTDVRRVAVHQHLADIPRPLEVVGQINPVGAPDDVPGRRIRFHGSILSHPATGLASMGTAWRPSAAAANVYEGRDRATGDR
jgi:hypothetical protein